MIFMAAEELHQSTEIFSNIQKEGVNHCNTDLCIFPCGFAAPFIENHGIFTHINIQLTSQNLQLYFDLNFFCI